MKSEKEQNEFGTPKATFKPIEYGGRRWLKITIVAAILVLLAGIGVVYWFFYRPKNEGHDKAQATSSHFVEEDSTDFTEDEIESPGFSEEASVMVEPRSDVKDAVVAAPVQGSLSYVNVPQGLHYIIVGSFVDDFMAEEYAKKLFREGCTVSLITSEHFKLVYVALDPQPTFQEASEKRSQLQAIYGEKIWILKY